MIIFDFDGVLIDPLKELALVVYNQVTPARLTSTLELPPGYLELFIYNRHLSVTPIRIVSLALWTLKTLKAGGGVDTPLSREELDSMDLDPEKKFTAAGFFKVRQWLMDEYPEKWLNLNKPYPLIWNAVQKLDPNQYFILTNKNRTAVKKICSHFGLKISEPRLFTGEKGHTKHQNILELDKIGNRDTKYIFLDDAIENLETLYPVLPGRIYPVLATWGYGNSEDRLTAQEYGFELATEAEFVKKYLSE